MRILIVEDEFLIALLVEELVAELGQHEVLIAGDLDSGWEYLERSPPDFAILDVNVGRTLVFPLAAELARRNIPFVFATGQPPSLLPLEWRQSMILEKPLQRKAFNAAVSELGLVGQTPGVSRCG